MSSTQVRAHVVRSFTDAGTGAAFTKDDKPLLDQGLFENYCAAGLVKAAVEEPDAEAPAKQKGRPAKSPEIPPAGQAE